jgi:hypothetical protein
MLPGLLERLTIPTLAFPLLQVVFVGFDEQSGGAGQGPLRLPPFSLRIAALGFAQE